MLRLVQISNQLPYQVAVDPDAAFQPGMIMQLKSHGNNIVGGVSDGTAPLGIIDDIRTNAFSTAAINEEVIVPSEGVINSQGKLVSTVELKKELNNPNINLNSFVSYYVDVELIARNGVVIFLAGTELNYSRAGNGIPDAIRTVVSYSYQIPNMLGDDSTLGSGKITFWFGRLIAQTDQYDTATVYPLNANLFVNESGLLTTRQISLDYPAMAQVTGPPSPTSPLLELLWF